MKKLKRLLVWYHTEVETDPFGGVVEVDPGQGSGGDNTDKGGLDNGDGGSGGDTGNDLPENAPKWLAGVKPELRKDLMDFKNPNDLASKYLELTTKAKEVEGAIFVPGEGAKDEDITAFQRAIGVPEKAEDYPELDIEIPEGVNINLEPMKQNALLAGVPAEAYKKFMALQMQSAIKNTVEFTKSVQQKKDAAAEAMKTQFGEKYESVKANANLLLEVGGDHFKGVDAEKGLTGDARFMAFVMNVANKISEDALPSGGNLGSQTKRRTGIQFEHTPEHS